MKRRDGKATLVIISMMTLAAAATDSRAGILNGDFEDTTGWGSPGDSVTDAPVEWRDSSQSRDNPAGKQTGADAIGGAGVSAYMPAFATSTESERRDMRQQFDTTLGADWTLTFDFAAEDPGDAGDRSLSGSLGSTGQTGVVLSFRVVDEDKDGDGDFQLFDGSAWQSIPDLKDAVVFDADVQTSPLVHSITFEADWSAATAAGRALDVSILDSNGVLRTTTGLEMYRETVSQDDQLDAVEFNTFLSDGDYLLDNFRETVIPEPASLAMLTLGAFAMLRRRSA